MKFTRTSDRFMRSRFLPASGVLPAMLLAVAALGLNGCANDEPVVAVDTSCAVLTDTGSVVVGSGVAGDPSAPEPS